jgi:hypothetical protein
VHATVDALSERAKAGDAYGFVLGGNDVASPAQFHDVAPGADIPATR